MPGFLFRADASTIIGSGHVMRCLTLARALRSSGADCSFACRTAIGDLRNVIRAIGFPVYEITSEFDPADDASATLDIVNKLSSIDWLVTDHYGLDLLWEKKLSAAASHLLVINDLAERSHHCAILLDPNYTESGMERWRGLVDAQCRVLAGPQFALLREEFFTARRQLRHRDGRVKRLLISFGGADSDGAALLVLQALQCLAAQDLLAKIVCEVIAGGANPHRAQLQAMTAALPHGEFADSVDNMAQRMAAADLALGAGGITMWERCYLGLPCLTVILADNQHTAVEAVARYGAHWNLGRLQNLSVNTIADTLAAVLHDAEALQAASERCLQLMGEPAFIRNPMAWLT
jgi:UDP-2,4-diacetamido-2,4,6-trideoxy-beta-L-altropyranose hydrolase